MLGRHGYTTSHGTTPHTTQRNTTRNWWGLLLRVMSISVYPRREIRFEIGDFVIRVEPLHVFLLEVVPRPSNCRLIMLANLHSITLIPRTFNLGHYFIPPLVHLLPYFEFKHTLSVFFHLALPFLVLPSFATNACLHTRAPLPSLPFLAWITPKVCRSV